MHYFALQVRTADEDMFISRAELVLTRAHRLFCPKRVLRETKGGKRRERTHTVFPGYVFLEMEDLDADTRWQLRRVRGFFRFLKDTHDPQPLAGHDRELLLRFISFGKAADISKVTFDENERIVVLAGPLQGLEGMIVKVDRRRGRAKIRLDMCETGFLVDFGFEAVTKATKDGEATDGGAGS